MKNSDIEPGDRLLFNDRKHPVRVKNITDEQIEIEGPEGGIYYLKPVETGFIISSSPSFSYNRSVENMRFAGEWKSSDENRWEHSLTDREIEVYQKENGFWQVRTDLDFEGPRYGFTSKAEAASKAKELMRDNPEG